MKLRPRFCDWNVLGKDITRFAPVWAIYLIGGLLLTIPTLADRLWQEEWLYRNINVLSNYTATFSIINLVYGLVVAQLLFGDLFNSRLCNALHAMPLRRETWYVSHLVSGLLFSLVPNLIGALSFMPFLGRFWYVAFLWLGGMMLHYILFFGMAVLSMEATGNRFAAVVVYGILNFGAVLVYYLVQYIYTPLLYGVDLSVEWAQMLTPIVLLMSCDELFWLRHDPDCCDVNIYSDGYGLVENHIQQLRLGDGWLYFLLAAGVGLLFLGLAVLLYRRRQLETAGNFVAFKPMKPIFRIIFTIAVAGFCHMVAAEMFGMDELTTLIFALVGLIVGYFVSHMFVERTVKVFKKRTFLGLAGITALVVLSLLCTAWDIFGIASYIPAPDQVDTAYMVGYKATGVTLEELEEEARYGYVVRVTGPEAEALTQVHSQLYQAGEYNGNGQWANFTIVYKLKDGRTVQRVYRVSRSSQEYVDATALFSKPYTALGADTLQELKEQVTTILSEAGEAYPVSCYDSLLEALWVDCQAGCLLNSENQHLAVHGKEDYYTTLTLRLGTTGDGKELRRNVSLYDCCESTIAWLKDNQLLQTLTWSNYQELAKTGRVVTELGTLADYTQRLAFLQALYTDIVAENVHFDRPTGSTWCQVRLDVPGEGSLYAYINPDCKSYHVLLDLLQIKA